jgi:hypothetical protein
MIPEWNDAKSHPGGVFCLYPSRSFRTKFTEKQPEKKNEKAMNLFKVDRKN